MAGHGPGDRAPVRQARLPRRAGGRPGGEHTRAAELLGLAHALQGYRNAASLEVTRASAAAAAAIGDEAYAAAYARGQLLTRDDALALVP